MHESTAQANGYRPGATERLVPAPAAPLVEPAPVRRAKHRERQIWIAVLHVWIAGASVASVIFVGGLLIGMQVAR